MNALKINSIASFLILSGCATQSLNKSQQAWIDLGKSEAYQEEKVTYNTRMSKQEICWDIGLDDFLKPNPPKPNDKCIYPASKFIVDTENGLITQSKTLRQEFKQLKILQVSSKGFVIDSANYRNDQVIFVYKTNEENLVDGSFLDDSQNFMMYEYAGTYSYATLVGSKTVYSFRKANKKIGEAKKDLKYYEPLRDFLIANQLWTNLGEYPKN